MRRTLVTLTNSNNNDGFTFLLFVLPRRFICCYKELEKTLNDKITIINITLYLNAIIKKNKMLVQGI